MGVPPSDETVSLSNGAVLTGACCVALATLVPVALYQTGHLSRLPDPPSALFDTERITTSKAARPFGIPDALLGLGSFAATLALILLAKRDVRASKLLGAKLTLDASVAAFNATRQVASFGKLCSWCTGTALAAGVMAYFGRETIHDTWTDIASFAKTRIAQNGKIA